VKIPKLIHQVHTKGLNSFSKQDQNARTTLLKNNPDWEYRFYDYNDMISFIESHYSGRYLHAFLSINPLYGAAQADYFRYLLIYKLGGAYFDIKSFTTCALTNLVLEDDDLIVLEWQGGISEYENFGKHKEIQRGREYQQWNIISSANNDYLAEVIEQVTQNIENYSVFKFGYGWSGVLKTTGPIPYTNAIDKIVDKKGFRCLGSSCQNGIIYRDNSSAIATNKTHYSQQTAPLIIFPNNKIKNLTARLSIFLLRFLKL